MPIGPQAGGVTSTRTFRGASAKRRSFPLDPPLRHASRPMRWRRGRMPRRQRYFSAGVVLLMAASPLWGLAFAATADKANRAPRPTVLVPEGEAQTPADVSNTALEAQRLSLLEVQDGPRIGLPRPTPDQDPSPNPGSSVASTNPIPPRPALPDAALPPLVAAASGGGGGAP